MQTLVVHTDPSCLLQFWALLLSGHKAEKAPQLQAARLQLARYCIMSVLPVDLHAAPLAPPGASDRSRAALIKSASMEPAGLCKGMRLEEEPLVVLQWGHIIGRHLEEEAQLQAPLVVLTWGVSRTGKNAKSHTP